MQNNNNNRIVTYALRITNIVTEITFQFYLDGKSGFALTIDSIIRLNQSFLQSFFKKKFTGN